MQGTPVNGRDRNLPCACGSGKKTKRCVPGHPPTEAEMNTLHAEAEYEDMWRVPGYRTIARRRAQDAILIASALAVHT